MKKILQDNAKQLYQFLQGETNVSNTLKIALNKWSNSLNNENKGDAKTKILQRRNSNLPSQGFTESIEASLKQKKLILHGFYFITPLQERVFNRLEDEYELVFLNPYDSRFPHTFETVKSFLGINENETYKAVRDDVAIHPLAARLVESFEGGSKIQIDQKVTVYSDLAHFVEAEKNRYQNVESESDDLDEPFHLLTPRAAEVEKQLIANEFVLPSQKKLTDYPVGRFLYRLHQMKSQENDLNTGTVTINEQVTAEALLDCFASGCLIVDGEDMRTYLKPLEKILPYCKKISTFEQWQSQMKDLMKEKEAWENKVLEDNPYALSNRNHKFHSFPMRQLSYFSVDKEDMEKILLGIKLLNGIHTALFSKWETKKINISTHLKTLEQYVLKDVEEYFENAEKNIVKKLIEEISELKDEELEFSLKDISQGLMFYLDGTLHEIANPEITTDKVFAFDSADGAPFRSHRKFHLAFVDNKALPISQGFNMWPISRELMKHLEDGHPELRLLEERKKQGSSITRYLLYVLFHSADDVRFSYVKHLGSESRLELALYLKLLGCETENASRDVVEIKEGINKEEHDDVTVEDAEWTISMEREAKVCGKRAAFSFILNEHTTFKSDFHHGFLYQNYISVLDELVEDQIQPSEIRTLVDSWFPQWNNMKKNFLYESRYTKRGISKDKIELKDRRYSQGVSYLHLLPNSYASRKSDVVDKEEILLNEADPGKHCQYCPYLSVCRDGIYQMDFEEVKFSSNSTKKGSKSTTKVKEHPEEKNKNFSIYDYLISKGLSVVDKREKGGCIWVVGGENLQPLIDDLASRDIIFRFSSKGSHSTKNQSAWYSKG